jgi:hypothetical protein
MSNGFDLYLPNRGAPSHTFKVENKKKFVKNGVFGEAGKVAIACFEAEEWREDDPDGRGTIRSGLKLALCSNSRLGNYNLQPSYYCFGSF